MQVETKNLVLNQAGRFISGQFLLAFVILIPVVFSTGKDVFYSRLIKISELQNYSTDEKRDIFNTFDTEDQNDTFILGH